jgi:hypothetical protein
MLEVTVTVVTAALIALLPALPAMMLALLAFVVLGLIASGSAGVAMLPSPWRTIGGHCRPATACSGFGTRAAARFVVVAFQQPPEVRQVALDLGAPGRRALLAAGIYGRVKGNILS